jgi:hypothetical protein
VDDDIRDFFKRISKTIMLVFMWLAITCIAAIKGDNAFVFKTVSLANILFYTWMVVSAIMLVVIIRKIWKGQKRIQNPE